MLKNKSQTKKSALSLSIKIFYIAIKQLLSLASGDAKILLSGCEDFHLLYSVHFTLQ